MSGKFWGNIGLGAVLVCLVGFAVTKISASSGVEGLFLPEVKVSDSTAELLHSVELVRAKVMIQKKVNNIDAAFGIENRGGHDIKNISILCTSFDTNGKEQGRDKWIVFDTVKSHARGDFTFSDKKFISDTVVRSECQIVDLEVAKAPLITVHRGAAGHGTEHGGEADAAHDTGHGNTH